MSGKRIQLKRGTTAQNSTFTGLDGEVTVDTTKKTLVIHDGTTVGGTVLAKDSDVALKVDKVVGKQLSTEDYTTAEKSKLAGIAASANNYTHPASGVSAGTYRSVTVDANGHVTAGTNPTTVSGYGLTDAYTKTEVNTSLALKVNNSEKGVANGVATLDGNGKVVLTQIPDSVLGQLEYMGTWNFTTMPTATQKGQYWIANTSGNGYVVGDWAVWNGSAFDKVDNTDAVASVAGRTGNVVLTKSDVGLANVDNTADSAKNVLSATKWTTARTLSLAGDVTGSASIDGSGNVTINATVVDDSHSHIIADVDGLQAALDSKVAKVVSTDNAIPKFNGTTGDIQNSGVIIDDNNNVGIGVTPSAWESGWKAIDFASGLGIASRYNSAYITANSYYDLLQGATYKNNAPAGQYGIEAGQHKWYTSPSGTAGQPITWTNAMTLGINGNLLVGTTTDNSTKLQVGVKSSTDLATGTDGLLIKGSDTRNTQLLRTGDSYNYNGVSGTGALLYSYDKLSLMSDTGNPIVFSANGYENMRVSTSGNLLVGTTTDNGTKLKVQTNPLGTSKGDYQVAAEFGVHDGNNSRMQISSYRHTAGSTWLGTELRLQRIVDDTKFGYVGFSKYGTAFGVGITEQMRLILDNGNLLLGTTTDNGIDKLQVNGSATIYGSSFTLSDKDVLPLKNLVRFVNLGLSGITGCINYTIRGTYQNPNGIGNEPDGGKLDLIKSLDGKTILATDKDGNSLTNVLIGTTTDNGVDKLQVNGNISTKDTINSKVTCVGGDNFVALASGYTDQYISSLSTRHGIRFLRSPDESLTTYTEDMRITNEGNLLVGTTTDNGVDKLQVNGSIKSTTGLFTSGNVCEVARTTAAVSQNAGAGAYLQLSNPTNGHYSIIQQSLGDLQFINYTGGGWYERARITNRGNLLVGTTTDNGEKLQVIQNGIGNHGVRIASDKPDGSTVRFVNSDTNGRSYAVGSTGGTSGAGVGFSVYDLSNNSSRLLIHASGNISIGTTIDNGIDKLQVNGSMSTKIGNFTFSKRQIYSVVVNAGTSITAGQVLGSVQIGNGSSSTLKLLGALNGGNLVTSSAVYEIGGSYDGGSNSVNLSLISKNGYRGNNYYGNAELSITNTAGSCTLNIIAEATLTAATTMQYIIIADGIIN